MPLWLRRAAELPTWLQHCLRRHAEDRDFEGYLGLLAIAFSLGLTGVAIRQIAPVVPTQETASPATLAAIPLIFKLAAPPDALVTSGLVAHRAARGRTGVSGQGSAMAASNEQPGAIKERAKSSFIYKVEPGDTIGEIAEKFGITVDTIVSANDIASPNMLRIDTELTILPVPALVHVVAEGDTLAAVAAEYGIGTEDIAAYNHLSDPAFLRVGARLVVPEPKIEPVRMAASSRGGRPGVATGTFMWPTVARITTYFSAAHHGVDIAANMGVPIYASEGGTVEVARKDGGDYGWHIVIDHGNGYETQYGHLSAFYVDYGEKVAKGDRIGAVGSTGLSTGPHLHFEVWENGTRINPLNVLP